ncbi:hypothetical protein APA_4256 [Pseudanabaena sp. lw0831]|nr:hypothetical protein APA_4256 [Pseudanabaena sp. lw0831]
MALLCRTTRNWFAKYLGGIKTKSPKRQSARDAGALPFWAL